MTMMVNHDAYAKLVAEDLDWLLQQPRTLEREHIEAVPCSSDRQPRVSRPFSGKHVAQGVGEFFGIGTQQCGDTGLASLADNKPCPRCATRTENG